MNISELGVMLTDFSLQKLRPVAEDMTLEKTVKLAMQQQFTDNLQRSNEIKYKRTIWNFTKVSNTESKFCSNMKKRFG